MKNLATAPMKFLLIVFFAFALNVSNALAAEGKIIVVGESALDVAEYLKKIGFYDIDNHPERLHAVPRTRIFRLNETVPDVVRENVLLRKSVFYRLGLSSVLQVNEEIIVQRERLLSLSLDNLSAGDGAWKSAMMARQVRKPAPIADRLHAQPQLAPRVQRFADSKGRDAAHRLAAGWLRARRPSGQIRRNR